MPDAKQASKLGYESVLAVLLVALALWFNIKFLVGTPLAPEMLAVSVIGGMAMAYVVTSKMLRSVEDNGEYKLPVPPILLTLTSSIFFAVLPLFAGGFIRMWTFQELVFFLLLIISAGASYSLSTIWFYRRWEDETKRRLLSENAPSVMRLYATPKTPPP